MQVLKAGSARLCLFMCLFMPLVCSSELPRGCNGTGFLHGAAGRPRHLSHQMQSLHTCIQQGPGLPRYNVGIITSRRNNAEYSQLALIFFSYMSYADRRNSRKKTMAQRQR